MKARFRIRPYTSVAAAVALFGCNSTPPTSPQGVDLSEYKSGGETTVFNATSQAFTFPAPNITNMDLHLEGDLAFESSFVKAPAAVNAGLGPVFNNSSCVNCHGADGRGRPPLPGEAFESMLLRVSIPGPNPSGTGEPNPVPGYGTQLNDKALFLVAPEGRPTVTYSEIVGQFADGESYVLLAPSYAIESPYSSLPGDLLMSPRVALPVFGRGLLEAIAEETILALADPTDANGDGISGRPNYVWDVLAGNRALGRFGWKANQPSLYQQAAAAYVNDMGVTNPLFRSEAMAGQPQDDGMGDDPEITDAVLDAAVFYTQTLAVPARRNVYDAVVRRGERLFAQANCSGCHTPGMQTGVLPGVPSVSHQTIRPYTDMLLHDMGNDLADVRPDFEANGNEWRTPPLWGIGLTYIVHGHTHFLHDGRARNIMEAIMWHGGEAEASREFVRALPGEDRRALIAFLESL